MTGRRFPLTKVSASESLVDVPAWKIEMKNKSWKVLSKQTKKMCFISESDPQLRADFVLETSSDKYKISFHMKLSYSLIRHLSTLESNLRRFSLAFRHRRSSNFSSSFAAPLSARARSIIFLFSFDSISKSERGEKSKRGNRRRKTR